MALSRQQKRAIDRERQKLHANLYENGLPLKVDMWTTVFTHHLLGLLRVCRDDHRAVHAAEACRQIFDKSLARNPQREPLACRIGCSLCCHYFVTATIPEVLLIAKHIKAMPGHKAAKITDDISASNEITAGMDVDQRASLRSPCPLLIDDLCSVYSLRPLACRGFASLSLPACQKSEGDTGKDMPKASVPAHYRVNCGMAMWAALKGSGLSHRNYELTAALNVALSSEDAEKRWLAGEDVFAGVQVDTDYEPDIEDVLDDLIEAARI